MTKLFKFRNERDQARRFTRIAVISVMIMLLLGLNAFGPSGRAHADQYDSLSAVTDRMTELKTYFPNDGEHYWSGGKTEAQLIAAANSTSWSQAAFGVTSSGCRHNSKTACSCHSYKCTSNSYAGGTQCWGFARYMGYLLWPEYGNPQNCKGWTKISGSAISSVTLEPGDIICQGNTIHSAIVYKVSGSTVTVAEVWGNHGTKVGGDNHGSAVGCQIAWGYYNGNSGNKSMSTILTLVKNAGGYILKHPTVTASLPEEPQISGATYPKDLSNGQSFGLRGTISCKYTMTEIRAIVTNRSTGVEVFNVPVTLNSTSYSIGNPTSETINSQLKFGDSRLNNSYCNYSIYVKYTKDGTTCSAQVMDYNFTVGSPSSLTPTSLELTDMEGNVLQTETYYGYDDDNKTYYVQSWAIPYDADNTSVTWSSSNPNVLAFSSAEDIDGGGTLAIFNICGVGQSTVLATSIADSSVSASFVLNYYISSVSLSQTSISLSSGNAHALTATIVPSIAQSSNLVWSSSNTSVATVSNTGVVTAKAVGTATIYARANDGSNKSASCTVTVTQPVTSISVSPTALALNVGDAATLAATVSPSNASNKAVTWNSSNTAVAAVDANGKVTAKGPGSATITVTAADGSDISASVKVTVNPILVESIVVTNVATDQILYLEYGTPFDFQWEVYPSNATDITVTWSSSNTDVIWVPAASGVPGVDEDVCADVFYEGCGTTKITVTANDGSGVYESIIVTVYEQEATSPEYFYGSISNNEVTITGFDQSCGVTEVVVPSTVEGYPVTSISSAFKECSSVTSITLPDSLKTIGDYAFYGCSSLTSITIPDGVTAIPSCAFAGCYALESISLPDSITSIGKSAFRDCKSLTAIVLPESVTSIGDHAFRNCSSLINIAIPEGVTSIDLHTFNGCTKLAGITLPEGLTSIGDQAFNSCSSFTSVTIPAGVTSIGSYAFHACSSLENVTLSEGLTSIGGYAFNRCCSLTSMVLPEGLTSIGSHTFYGCSKLEIVTIPSSVTSLGDAAFRDCSSLITLSIPDSVTSIGMHAFNGCNSLTSITLSENLTSIGAHTFNSCSNLTSVTIPEGVTSLGGYAFHGCSSLSDVTLPDEMTSIDDYAFNLCTGLVSVNLPENLQNLGSYAFYGCSKLEIATIPSSVTSLGDAAFRDCTSLTSVSLPKSVTNIGSHAFYGCNSLKAITLPDDITNIGSTVFSESTVVYAYTSTVTAATLEAAGYSYRDLVESLKTLRLPASLTVIEAEAFVGSPAQRVVIPSGCTTISARAFANCSDLVRVEIPASVTNIAWDAFSGCTQLTIVAPEGSTAYSFATNLGVKWLPE